MKLDKKLKYKFNLQLLTGGNTEPTEPTTEPTTEDKAKDKEETSTEPTTEPEKKYTDEDVDKIVAKKLEKERKKKEKELEEAKKLASMNELEKAEHEKKKLLTELEELRLEKARTDLKVEAKKMLKEEELVIDDSLIDLVVTNEAESTRENVKALAKTLKDEVARQVKEQLRGKTPSKGVTSNTLTKEKIMNVKNDRERLKLIRENPNLFR